MFKTRVYTKPDYANDIEAKAKCIFNKELPFIVTKDYGITILDGYCVEDIDYIYVGLHDLEVEVHLKTIDKYNEYPEVDWR